MNSVFLSMTTACIAFAATAQAHAATWSVDPARSELGFEATQSGAPFTGKFKTYTALIDFDPAKPEAAHVVVDVDLASATTGDTQKDEAMPGADWFDTSTFAKARFEATGFEPKGGDNFEAHGKLTMRGVSKDVTLPFTLSLASDTAHAVGKAKLVRTDFGVGQGAWSTGDMVGLDVTVDVDLVAAKK